MDAHAAEQGRERQLPYVQRRNDKSMASSSSVAASAASAQDSETDSEQLPYTINVHNPAVSYGGIDPEIEENIQFIKDVSDRGLRVPGTESGGKSRSQATKRRLSPSPFRSTKGTWGIISCTLVRSCRHSRRLFADNLSKAEN